MAFVAQYITSFLTTHDIGNCLFLLEAMYLHTAVLITAWVGPLLLLLYINDICNIESNCSSSRVILFADDT